MIELLKGGFMTYLLTFLEGLASFVSPCILPLVPLYISYFSGANATNTKKAFTNSLFFVLGFTLIFVLMAVLTSTLGAFISSNMRYIKYIFGALTIILGLIYLDIFKLKFLNSALNIKFDLTSLNVFRSFIFGILFSVSHTPCIGYFIGSALMLVIR
jgi:cytochrome c-type biogenesis protein